MSRVDDHLRSFGMSGHLITDDLQKVERRFGIQLGHTQTETREAEGYYPQFDQAIRAEASQMATHYELFYCLEQSIRELIVSTLFEKSGPKWWDESVPEKIRSEVDARIERETDSGFSLRSEAEIDYTTFGELAVVITTNWDVFGAIFSSKRAVERIMSGLNMLRGPIAHCSPLAEDEVDRLYLTMKDWFRSMS